MTTPHILVFYGSDRPGAAAPKVAEWLKGKLATDTRATFEFVDLHELALPLYNIEWPVSPEGPFPSPAHEAWSKAVAKADGFIVITNEYNHAPGPIIKNAIDLLKAQWGKKPVGIMSYGGVGGGIRAAEHLRQVFAELYAMTIREQMTVHHVYAQYDAAGKLKDDAVTGDLTVFTDLLLWWTNALKTARAQG
jgi:NAD(P)H-dependent FMN reductase